MRTLLSALVSAATGLAPVQAAPPPGACHRVEPARAPVRAEPWAQRTLDLTAVRPHGTGRGAVVAVIDSGVDADHPQLPGVLAGQDFHLVGDLPGDFDCDSHGTAVAGIIAARPVAGTGFAGVAPDARILPLRVAERAEPVDPVVLARAIWYAADHGADVINLSLAGTTDDRYVRDAVAHARARDVLVVAAAGNLQQDSGTVPSFPAAYDGVLGVGAVDPTGARLGSSQTGPYVDLVAPGAEVLAPARAGGHRYWQGTSFAAPFVSGAAALVRAARPDLTAEQVAARLIATATPAPGGVGLVDPYRALTDELATGAPAVVPPAAAPEHRPAPDGPGRTARMLLVLATGLVVLAGLVSALTARGRRTRWQVRRADPVTDRPAEPEPAPEQLFGAR